MRSSHLLRRGGAASNQFNSIQFNSIQFNSIQFEGYPTDRDAAVLAIFIAITATARLDGVLAARSAALTHASALPSVATICSAGSGGLKMPLFCLKP